MKRMLRIFLCTLFCFFLANQGAVSAQIFKCVDNKGNTTFQDSECPGDKKSETVKATSKANQNSTLDCSLYNLPSNFEVMAIGKYDGITDTNYKLGNSGHKVKTLDVYVTYDKNPIVLALMAYDPVIWKVRTGPNVTIAGVIVSGYHKQAIVGISRETPLRQFSYEEKSTCGYFYAYKANNKLTAASKRLEHLTGKPISKFHHSVTDNRIYVGDKRLHEYEYTSSNDYKVEDFVNAGPLFFGREGIDQLLEDGLIRLAKPTEREQWVEKASEQYKKFNNELKVRPSWAYDSLYMVLDKVVLPDGLYGGNSVSFLIPAGTPTPSGPKGHCTFYFLQDGSCKGAGCPR